MDRTIKNAKLLIDNGYTQKQIADNFNMSPSGLRKWLKKHDLKTKMMIDRRTWTDGMLKDAVNSSVSIADVIRKLGLSLRPGNYPTVRNAIKRLELDTLHFKGKSHGNGGSIYKLKDVMIENSSFSRTNLKRKMLKEGLIENKCEICGLKEWNDKPIIMILDHINGVNNDHRRKNLRMLCPNCNSQQDTFCGKNKKGV